MEERLPHKELPSRPQTLSKCTIPEIKETSTDIPRLCQLLPQLYSAVVRKATRLLRATEADKQIKVTEELLDHYKAINAALAEACGLALKQPITGRQYVLMTDASFRASGYALTIEEENDKKLNSKKKTFAPVAFGSKVFSPAQLKMSIYCKEFQAIHHAFLEYSHILWETTLPTLVMTDNRSVTRFFQTKAIPPHYGMHVTTYYRSIFTSCT